MAFSGLTTFLGLRKITAQDSNWFADYEYNNNRIDLVGKQVGVQSGDGQPLKFRFKTVVGALIDAITVTDNNSGGVNIALGRVGKPDSVDFSSQNFLFDELQLNNSANTAGNTSVLKVISLKQVSSVDATFVVNVEATERTQQNTPNGNPTSNQYVGSAAQFELDPTGTLTTPTQWFSHDVTPISGVAARYIQPTYRI